MPPCQTEGGTQVSSGAAKPSKQNTMKKVISDSDFSTTETESKIKSKEYKVSFARKFMFNPLSLLGNWWAVDANRLSLTLKRYINMLFDV